ncbi:MAG: hypothetical protein GZ086_05240 [Gelidibacter sp.]|nr:hypothetical protein [Gelidibacter sp.]
MNKDELNSLLKNGNITLKEFEKRLDILNGKIDNNIDEIQLINKINTDIMKNISEMTSEEVNKEQLRILHDIADNTKKTRKNTAFLVNYLIVSIAISVIFVIVLLFNI